MIRSSRRSISFQHRYDVFGQNLNLLWSVTSLELKTRDGVYFIFHTGIFWAYSFHAILACNALVTLGIIEKYLESYVSALVSFV